MFDFFNGDPTAPLATPDQAYGPPNPLDPAAMGDVFGPPAPPGYTISATGGTQAPSFWSGVSSWFGGGSATTTPTGRVDNPGVNPSGSSSSGIGDFFSSIEHKTVSGIGSFFSSAGTVASNAVQGVTRTAGKGVGAFLGGITSGAGIPTMLIIVGVLGVVVYFLLARVKGEASV